jgi:hypothetical protein
LEADASGCAGAAGSVATRSAESCAPLRGCRCASSGENAMPLALTWLSRSCVETPAICHAINWVCVKGGCGVGALGPAAWSCLVRAARAASATDWLWSSCAKQGIDSIRRKRPNTADESIPRDAEREFRVIFGTTRMRFWTWPEQSMCPAD